MLASLVIRLYNKSIERDDKEENKMKAMKKVPNQNYEDGMMIFNYLKSKNRDVRLVKHSKVTHIYKNGAYFDTFDNKGQTQGYMLVAK